MILHVCGGDADPMESVAVVAHENRPNVVGVPLICPAEFIARPVGSDPPVTA